MKLATFLVTLCYLATTATAAINGRCDTGQPIGLEGVCVSTTNCQQDGGKYVNGKCPNDPANIKCCYKNNCSPYGDGGACSWSCPYTPIRGVCPGPAGFTCCVS